MNILCAVSYDGSDYFGWQIQPDKISVQETIEKALEIVFGFYIKITSAGRTDTGVHALKNYFNFIIEQTTIPVKKIPIIINNNLPESIRILSAELVAQDFNSRHSGIRRIYEYYIINGEKNPFQRKYRLFYNKFIDVDLLNTAIKQIIGIYDFSGFKAADCNSKTQIREIYNAEVLRINNEVIIRVEANAFLKNMIRIIVGTLLTINEKKKKIDIFKKLLITRDRKLAGPTVKPNGLFLIDAHFKY